MDASATTNDGSGFANFSYWSSTEDGDGYAWELDFVSGFLNSNIKSYTTYVRAVRAF
ncbi:MAG: hypothetical protein WD578_05605 [Bacteroidales bacterium]